MDDSAFRLTMITGPRRGESFHIRAKLTIGRDLSCDVVLDDPKVSRHHGTFVIRGSVLHYIDNKSTNGTLFNGRRVTESELQPGDMVHVGSSEISIFAADDEKTIQFVSSESHVTSVINTSSIQADALADKFQQIFEYYRDNQPEVSEVEQVELVRSQRMLNSLKTLYRLSQDVALLMPLEELLAKIAENLFEVFGGAENIVVLLDEEDRLQVAYFANRDGETESRVPVSQTVLKRALEERSTIIANNAVHDSRFSASESIVGSAVKAVMCAPLVVADRALGAIYLDNRLEKIQYDDMDAELLTAFANQAAIAINNANLCDRLQKSYHQTLQSLVNAIEAKDPYTVGHTQRVSRYAMGIGREFDLSDEQNDRLRLAAELHDIGKIGVKEGIINKSGALTDTEYMSIQDHVELGDKILRPITYLKDVLPIIRCHHERWDGSGYPDGLQGEECPLEGRILGVADSYDAMTSKRTYNQPLTFREALNRIKEEAGRKFDPAVVEAFENFVNRDLIDSDDQMLKFEDSTFSSILEESTKREGQGNIL